MGPQRDSNLYQENTKEWGLTIKIKKGIPYEERPEDLYQQSD